MNTLTGKREFGIKLGGCFAKYVESSDLRWETPDWMSAEEAATVPVVYLTAAYALFEKGRLEKGQSALVHAGTGGVGHAAICLLQSRGVEVFATCSTTQKKEYLGTETTG